MRARILFVSDLHKRDCDFTTIAGYTKAVDAVQRDLLSFIREKGITHLVSLGDWYDKGYRSINRSNNDRNFDEDLSRAVNGNFYICLGNHFFLERDNNPEMYLIQPSQYYKPTQPIYATQPVIRAVPSLRIGPVQISFFHYSKENKHYVQERDPDVKLHIGVYHDEVVIPTQQREDGGVRGTTFTSTLDSVFANIDLAITGHIHRPLGKFDVHTNGRTIPMIVPGSMCITTSAAADLHTEVQLPVVEITDEGNISCSLFTFDTHANLLRFYKKKEKMFKAPMPEQSVTNIPKTVSLKEYLSARGFTQEHLALVEAAAEADVPVVQGLRLLGIIGG